MALNHPFLATFDTEMVVFRWTGVSQNCKTTQKRTLNRELTDKMKLKPIAQNEDKTNEAYASADCQQLLQMYDDFYPKVGFNIPWIAYFVVRQDKIVGSCSFVGQPLDGKVEVAYWTFKEFEGQGIASFACKELVTIAKQTDPNVIITAKTAPERNASTKILENNNFLFTEIVQDEEIGDAWLWTYKGAKNEN